MSRRATRELIMFVMLYSLTFIIPRAFTSSIEASQNVIAWLLPLLILSMLGWIWHTRLQGLCGLETSFLTKPRFVHACLPYIPVLLIPALNIIFTGSELWQQISMTHFIIILCAAFCEELFIRGYLIGILLENSVRKTIIILVSTALFASLHLFNAFNMGGTYVLAQFFTASGMGLAFSCMRLSSKSVYPSTLVHLLINGTSGAAILCTSPALWIIVLSSIITGAWAFIWWRSHRTPTY